MSEPNGSPPTSPSAKSHDADPEHHPRKRQRVRLSCLECRRRKLSCDRGFPCERCLKSATPQRCTYETRPGLAPPPPRTGLTPGQPPLTFNEQQKLSTYNAVRGSGGNGMEYRDVREGDRIRRLELEIAHLRSLVSNKLASDGSLTLNDDTPSKEDGEQPSPEVLPFFVDRNIGCPPDDGELRFCRGKEFTKRHCGPLSTYRAFRELTGLTPFMKETSEEWLKPLHIAGSKDRGKRKRDRDAHFAARDMTLEALLPSQSECDALVELYLAEFEQLHRVVHIPSFRREYNRFWAADQVNQRYAAFTALLLAICSITTCLNGNTTGSYVGTVSLAHAQAEKWVKAVEDWHGRQSAKHRKLVHYQIACLLYLSKRVNTIKKKLFWKNAGSLLQDLVSVGLHKDPSQPAERISPFNQEMRRRLWATVQEFDMQASCDYGLPTLLATGLHVETEPPRNINDEEFDEDWNGKEGEPPALPPSRPDEEYTTASYQHLSRRSLPLRIHLSRVLTGQPEELDYEQIIQLTNDIAQEVDALPSWDIDIEGDAVSADAVNGADGVNGVDGNHDSTSGPKSKRGSILAHCLLHIQLRQYILPLHQPYLKLRKTHSKYQYSEILFYNAARDMVLLHDRLAKLGIRTLNFLREDVLMLSINLCMCTMLQPRSSSSMVMVNSDHTIKLLEQCLAMKEDRTLRCGNNEPWGYSIMCGVLGLLEAHLGVKTIEQADPATPTVGNAD